MSKITRPMLAGVCTSPSALQFPVLATPKLDGFRCIKIAGRALTRSFKPIPNVYAREWIEANVPDGCDGELMLRNGTFSESASALASRSGKPDFVFHVFDHVDEVQGLSEPYAERMKRLNYLALPECCEKVLPLEIWSEGELAGFEARCVDDGYEGVMVRSPGSPYKCGRSTEREGYLLKIKQFADEEAQIVGAVELRRNANAAYTNEVGATMRSTAQGSMVGAGVLGALLCRRSDGAEFSLGTGFDDAQRRTLWEQRDALAGRLVTFRHQPSGAKDLPRFPVFVALRESWDI